MSLLAKAEPSVSMVTRSSLFLYGYPLKSLRSLFSLHTCTHTYTQISFHPPCPCCFFYLLSHSSPTSFIVSYPEKFFQYSCFQCLSFLYSLLPSGFFFFFVHSTLYKSGTSSSRLFWLHVCEVLKVTLTAPCGLLPYIKCVITYVNTPPQAAAHEQCLHGV